jgi:hypothetical protein
MFHFPIRYLLVSLLFLISCPFHASAEALMVPINAQEMRNGLSGCPPGYSPIHSPVTGVPRGSKSVGLVRSVCCLNSTYIYHSDANLPICEAKPAWPVGNTCMSSGGYPSVSNKQTDSGLCGSGCQKNVCTSAQAGLYQNPVTASNAACQSCCLTNYQAGSGRTSGGPVFINDDNPNVGACTASCVANVLIQYNGDVSSGTHGCSPPAPAADACTPPFNPTADGKNNVAYCSLNSQTNPNGCPTNRCHCNGLMCVTGSTVVPTAPTFPLTGGPGCYCLGGPACSGNTKPTWGCSAVTPPGALYQTCQYLCMISGCSYIGNTCP